MIDENTQNCKGLTYNHSTTILVYEITKYIIEIIKEI